MCSICHMPMARAQAQCRRASRARSSRTCRSARGRTGEIVLAHDGVSCTLCHQISADNLGTPRELHRRIRRSDATAPRGDAAPMFGPFPIDRGPHDDHALGDGLRAHRRRAHARSRSCARRATRCITKALGPDGEVIGRLPEQVPYLEWRHSAFPREQQLPVLPHAGRPRADARSHRCSGRPRQGVARHIVPRRQLLHAADAEPLPRRSWASRRCRRSSTPSTRVDRRASPDATRPSIAIDRGERRRRPAGRRRRRAQPGRAQAADAHIRHGAPGCTLSVRDGAGATIFESGAVRPSGAIAGNDNDADPRGSSRTTPRSASRSRSRSTSPSWPIQRAPSRPGCCGRLAT